jgi:hypothetical protein
MITVRRVVISIILAFAIALLAFGFNGARDNTAPVFTNAAVEGTYPSAGDLDLRQTRIGIDLKTGYTAELVVDQTPIPDDQVEKVVGLDQYFFTPGPGTETGALAPGSHTATAIIHSLTDPNYASKYVWRFTLH